MTRKVRFESPCKGCTKRCAIPNCHDTCEAYAEWTVKRREYSDFERMCRSTQYSIKLCHDRRGWSLGHDKY